jgi:hypothetical protein
MSSDLLAEFDSFYRAPQKTTSNTAPASNDLSLLSGNNGGEQSEQQSGFPQWQSSQKTNDDIWGNMETFRLTPNKQPAAAQPVDIWGSFDSFQQPKNAPQETGDSRPSNGGFTTNSPRRTIPPDNPRIVRRPTVDMFSSDIGRVDQSTVMENLGAPPSKQPRIANSSHADVLFDAAEDPGLDDDDEFGEFETVTSEPPFQSATPTQSLNDMFGITSLESGTRQPPTNLSFASGQGPSIPSYPQAPKPPPFEQRKPSADINRSTGQASKFKEDKPKPASSVPVWPKFEPEIPKPTPYQGQPSLAKQPDDEWGDFSPVTPAVTSARASSGTKTDSWAWDSVEQVTETAPAQPSVAPPTNIPPPSVFLTLFPSLFDLPQSRLFKPVSEQTFSLKNRILSDPSTIEFLRGYLLIATVAARILAGRKLRWKRDTILSQSMRMGPAAAGGKGGMKLVGVDKVEITREDREAAEVVRIWKDQLGRLRSAIAVSNSSTPDSSRHLTIPDISENIHVKTQPGGLTAPKPCIICGLKRDERANKVDVDVEDSFGEWWIDHWGHRTCRNFWLEHESKLKSR